MPSSIYRRVPWIFIAFAALALASYLLIGWLGAGLFFLGVIFEVISYLSWGKMREQRDSPKPKGPEGQTRYEPDDA